MKFLSNAVSPRVAYLDKNTARWSVLPLICLTKVSWAFVLKSPAVPLPFASFAPIPDSIEMLGFTKEALSKSLSAQTGKTARIKVFSNYKEMDEHFLRAA